MPNLPSAAGSAVCKRLVMRHTDGAQVTEVCDNCAMSLNAPHGKEVNMKIRDFELHSHYLVPNEGWKHDAETLLDFTYEEAGEEASKVAKRLDETYGDGHFWTVDLTNTQGESYFQLFHGRLS